MASDDVLVTRAGEWELVFTRDGGDVIVEHGGASCVAAESGLGAVLCAVLDVLGGDIHELLVKHADWFLKGIVVPVARWLELSTVSLYDYARRNKFSWFDMVPFWYDSLLWGQAKTNHSSLMVPEHDGNVGVRCMSVGTVLRFGAHGYCDNDDRIVWLALSGRDDFDLLHEDMLIGPYTVEGLIHEFRVLHDAGITAESVTGLVVELAEREAARHTGVPRSVAMEDIIDGYPGADEYIAEYC